ncbi:MAG: cytochrome C [Thiovulaceae bacterium]|nr:cytochrome C [Sulfurimonadaceae bacterium]
MKVIYLILLVFLVSGCQNNNSTAELKTKYGKNSPQDNIKAKELYKKCQRCHGKKAELNALRKSDIIAYYKKEEIIEALKAYQKGKRERHRFGHLMKGIVSDFSDYEINILAEYISQLN